YPPPPPPGGPAKGKKLGIIIGSAVVAVALIGGGIFLVTSGDGDDDQKPKADKSVSASPSEPAESAEPSEDPATEDPATEEPSEDPATEDPLEDEEPTRPAGDTGFEGQWQNDENKTLTIGAKLTSGEGKGKNSVSYIDAGGKGLCMGLGQAQGTGFRIAVKCGSGDDAKFIAANLTQADDEVTMKWDKGGTDVLPWAG
ncbi:hypothetical protein, partial [Streptomyces sp. MZ04]|uniref:hypothetical protein n=1 Tax=Streptomyces sp. MZ04 TaxID=2559236 RepID=UPI0014329811